MEESCMNASGQILDSRPRRLLIDGRWVDAASGKTFPSINPSTGKVIAELAEGGAEDANRAVAAARRAFDEGPWPRMRPAERQSIIWALADAVAANFAELRMLEA